MKPSRLHLLPLLLVLAAPCLRAEQRIFAERIAVTPVSEVYIQVLATNEGSEPRQIRFSEKLRGTLHGGSDRSDPVELHCVDARSDPGSAGFERSIPAGSFERVRYRLTLPPGYLGPVVLDVPSFSPEPIMFSVQVGAPSHMPGSQLVTSAAPRPQPPAPAEQASVPAPSQHAEAVSPASPAASVYPGDREAVLRRLSQVLPGVSSYEPVYFGLGASGGLNAKFQVSLKYNPISALPLYAGFTQTSIWDLHGESKPFKDSAYRPSLFLLKDRFWSFGDKTLVVGLQSGFEHESNGKSGLDSRSINILFFRPRVAWIVHRNEGGDKTKDLRLVFSPKAYTYLEKSENSDIAEYRGYVDLYAALHYNDWKLSTVLRKGTRSNYGSIQVDAVFPMRESERFLSRFGVHGVNGYWFLQYFNGWGESIIDYRVKQPAQFRLGLMVVP